MTPDHLLRGSLRSTAEAPTWRVTITIERPHDEGPAHVSPSAGDSAATLGVSLEIETDRVQTRFLVRAHALRAATDSGFERWAEIHELLSLPNWPCSSIVVTAQGGVADAQVTQRPTLVPGVRCPYRLRPTG